MLGVLIGVLSVALLAAHIWRWPTPRLRSAWRLRQRHRGTGLGDLLADPGKWATTMFNAALIGLDEKATSDVVGFMGWLLGNGNLISQTPPGLYDSDAVARLWGTMRAVAKGGLGVVTVWGGVNNDETCKPHISVVRSGNPRPPSAGCNPALWRLPWSGPSVYPLAARKASQLGLPS